MSPVIYCTSFKMTITVLKGCRSQIDFSSLCVDAMFSGLLVDCNEDWSLRAEEGVLVICDDKIIERAPCEDLDNVLER